MMRILLIGSGAREHALAWKISQSPLVSALFVATGNAGIAQSVDLKIDDAAAVIAFCQKNSIDFVVIGPEKPLADGLSDALRAVGYPVFGPSQAAARLESSKAFMKTVCARAGVPTASYETFDDLGDALTYTQTLSTPIVIKADGLAAGKGVVIAQTHAEAAETLTAMMRDQCFGASGSRVVIETFLTGEEVSVFALCDGKTVRYMGHAQDHKRAFDGDLGPNTGGMGAYAPAPILDTQGIDHVMTAIMAPVAEAMQAMGCPFQGVLYAGLMMTQNGPFIIEFNARFGDPECEVLMPLIDEDLVPLLYACATETLDQHTVRLSMRHALCVVMATRGYPADYPTGSVIRGLPSPQQGQHDDVLYFHAATRAASDGTIIAHGGRVLCVVGVGETLALAKEKAYAAIKTIDWPEGFYRTDIGKQVTGDG